MSNITVTVLELAREARLLAQEFEDRKAICSYTRYEDDVLVPNCIVGTAANNLGISLEELYSVNTCGIRHLALQVAPEWLTVSESESEISVELPWLSALQGAQDGGCTWGEALAVADRRLVFNQFGI